MSVELDINSALNAHLATLPDRPKTAWDNKAFDPDGESLWLQVSHLPRNTDAPMLGDTSSQDYGGIYQITIMAAKNVYETPALIEADRIMDHFARGLELTHNGTTIRTRNAYRSAGLQDGNFYAIPVSIRYRAII